MISEKVVKLNDPQKFAETDMPILRLVVRIVGRTCLIAIPYTISVFSVRIAVKGVQNVKLLDAKHL